VKIDYVGLEENNQDVVNVLVRIEERHDNLAEFLVGGGVSTDDGPFAEVGARGNNLFGTGARLDVRASYGSQKQSVEGKLGFPRWIQRRVFGSAFLVEFAGLFINEVTPRFGDLQSIGGSMAVTKEGRLGGKFEGWLLSLRYDFRLRNRDEDLVRPAGPSDDIQRSKVRTISSTIGPVLVIDKRRDNQGRKNPLTPSRGWRFEVRSQFGEDYALGNNRFLKLGTSGQHFLRLSDRFQISNAVRYDHGIPLGDDVLLTEVERFFAGGDTTVRGFEEDRLATEIIEEQVPPLGSIEQFRVRPAGGNIRMVHNLELQVRLWDDPPVFHVPIASAIFLDSGLVTNSLDGFEIRQLRHSIGVALMRLVTPFGSLSIEYAMPLDPELGDNPRGRFHVNFGFLF
jgi:outer membrane protein assembly factor BamA